MNFKQYTQENFFVIAGPCVVESEEVCYTVAETLMEISRKLNIPAIFKASYKKANRTSVHSYTGLGDEKALRILESVRNKFDLPVLTDVHEVKDVSLAADIVDILQIPAFLCRQTDLIMAAGETGKPVNLKKGQFASADIMKYAVEKLISVGNTQGMFTERGTFFGYQDLVVDMRNIPQMKAIGVPVIYDATHSVQQPGKGGGSSGGMKEMIEPLTLAAVSAGADGMFIETHPQPEKARSDSSTMLALNELENILRKAQTVYELNQNL